MEEVQAKKMQAKKKPLSYEMWEKYDNLVKARNMKRITNITLWTKNITTIERILDLVGAKTRKLC